jgi:ppGpp synthetase/RelA/SpoT-type nucleotidyltranferase
LKPLEGWIASVISKYKIDELGKQLRQAATEGVALDVVALDAYRELFSDAINEVQKMLWAANLTEFTSRTKSTASVVDKLRRQPQTRLSQVQDILGLRFVANDLKQQEALMVELARIFPDSKLQDRRLSPQYGYRAVHLIVKINGFLLEIQVRSQLQHYWAQYSEMIADQRGQELKYGGGDVEIRSFLEKLSLEAAELERQLDQQDIWQTPEWLKDQFEKMIKKLST